MKEIKKKGKTRSLGRNERIANCIPGFPSPGTKPSGYTNTNEKGTSESEGLTPEEEARVVALWKEGRSRDDICGSSIRLG